MQLPGRPLSWALSAHLEGLASGDRHRTLTPKSGKDFSSNDYLAMCQDPDLRRGVRDALDAGIPIGSGGSRLLRGNNPEHEALEAEAAKLYGSEASLLFASGYAANSALLSTLPQTGDHIFHDEFVHASAREGMGLARCPRTSVRHNDVDEMESAIRFWRSSGALGAAWIVVESLYSMDGDTAPLAELAEIAERYGAWLVVDEAHATGVFGKSGCGLTPERVSGRENVVVLRTLGKALGLEGALLCCPAIVRDFLINRARGFIFSTAPSPLIAAAARCALRIVADADERRLALRELWEHAGRRLARHGAVVAGSQIMPLTVGDDGRTMQVAGRLIALGFDVRGIRPPTVPVGTSRLRIALTLNVDAADVDRLDEALEKVLR